MNRATSRGAVRSFILHPGELAAASGGGTETSWWRHLRLFLVCVVAYFATSGLVDALAETTSGPAGAQAVPGITLTADQRTRLLENVAGGALLLRLIDDPASVAVGVDRAVPLATCVLLPFFAFLLLLAYRQSKPRYLPHLIFSLHVHALFFATMAVAAVPRLIGSATLDVAVSLAALAYTSWYLVTGMQRVYGGSSSATLVRATVVGLAWGAALVVVVGAIGLAMLREG